MIRINIQIDNEDYGDVAKAVLPAILGTMGNKPGANMGVKLLSKFKGAAGAASAAAMTVLSKEKKDEMLANAISGYSETIMEKCNGLLIRNGVPLTVADMTAEQRNGIEVTIEVAQITDR